MQDHCFATQTVVLYLVANLLRNYVHFWQKVQVLTSQTTQATAFELGQLGILQLRPKVYLIGLFKRLVDGLLTAIPSLYSYASLCSRRRFKTIDSDMRYTHVFSLWGSHTLS